MNTLNSADWQKALNCVPALKSTALSSYGCVSSPLFRILHSRVRNHCPEIPPPIRVSLILALLSTSIWLSISGVLSLRRIFCIARTDEKDLLHCTEGTTVSPVIRRCQQEVYRVWLKGMTGTYPTYAYLKRVGLAGSPDCRSCDAGVPEYARKC
jgi:hypothetical protein